MSRGGKRSGAGRPRGTGRFSEPTKPVRIPESMLDDVAKFVQQRGYSCPLFSSRVAAGGPVFADEHSEGHVNLSEMLVRNPEDTFFVTVSGESMLNAGIHPDDLLVVDRSIKPVNGRIVVAAVNGEVTVKRLEKTANSVRLLPENPAYSPIEITDGTDFHIWGVVTNVVHGV